MSQVLACEARYHVDALRVQRHSVLAMDSKMFYRTIRSMKSVAYFHIFELLSQTIIEFDASLCHEYLTGTLPYNHQLNTNFMYNFVPTKATFASTYILTGNRI